MGASVDPCGTSEVTAADDDCFAFQDYFLYTAAKEVFHQFQHFPSHTLMMEFSCQLVVGYFEKFSSTTSIWPPSLRHFARSTTA